MKNLLELISSICMVMCGRNMILRATTSKNYKRVPRIVSFEFHVVRFALQPRRVQTLPASGVSWNIDGKNIFLKAG